MHPPPEWTLGSYILSRTSIPNSDSPNFRVRAVRSQSINRDVRWGSSAALEDRTTVVELVELLAQLKQVLAQAVGQQF
jgi:hypothetical protein